MVVGQDKPAYRAFSIFEGQRHQLIVLALAAAELIGQGVGKFGHIGESCTKQLLNLL